MKKFTVILFFILGLGVTSAFGQKRTVAGITFPPKTVVNGQNVIYNGSGLREKYTFDLYVAALYLSRPSMDAGKIITDDDELAHNVSRLKDFGKSYWKNTPIVPDIIAYAFQKPKEKTFLWLILY